MLWPGFGLIRFGFALVWLGFGWIWFDFTRVWGGFHLDWDGFQLLLGSAAFLWSDVLSHEGRMPCRRSQEVSRTSPMRPL